MEKQINKRHVILNKAMIICALSPSLLFTTNYVNASENNPTRPNVIFIFADDLGYGDLGCHGNPVVETPNIDSLSMVSTNFTNYHTNTYSTPTRASIMTGLYSHKTGARLTTTNRSLMYSDLLTLGDYFSNSGYSTALFGKWHIGGGRKYNVTDRGFQEVVSVNGGAPGTTRAPWKGRKYDDYLYHNDTLKQYKGYLTDVLFDEAMTYLKNRKKDNPFFVTLPTFAPHRPWNVPKEWANQYKGIKGVSTELAYFFATITRLDYNIGRLITFLKENDMYENTILIFSSDNGSNGGSEFFDGGHQGKKGSSFEHGHREPMIVHWPAKGLNKKVKNNALIADIDLLPTFIDLCDLKCPKANYKLDGRSFANLLLNKEEESVWDSRIHIIESPSGRGESFQNNRSIILKGPWRLINKTHLTNIETDPYQKTNLYHRYPGLVKELLDAYTAYWKEVSSSDKKIQPVYVGDYESCLSITGVKKFNNLWEQDQILRGVKGFGEWLVQFESDGVYEFDFRRWPKDVNKGLTEPVTVDPSSNVSLYDLPVYLNSFGNEKNQTSHSTQLPIDGVLLTVNNKEYFVKKRHDKALFKVFMKKGNYDLKITFVDKDKKEITGVYYTYVKKVNNK